MTHNEQSQFSLRLHRLKALESLGGICLHCSIDDPAILVLDHINGGGRQERRKIGPEALYRRAKDNSSEFQVLCHNCNFLKRLSRGEGVKYHCDPNIKVAL